MGLGAQMVAWDDAFCAALAQAGGHHVIHFDNRDIGHSTHLSHAGVPDIQGLMLQAMAGRPLQVPYTLRFENQTRQTIPIEVTVRLTLPTGNSITLREATINLGPNQDRDIRQVLNLPGTAPAGSYQMTIVANSAQFSTFDTCSFNAN